jgi:hypothetical protein
VDEAIQIAQALDATTGQAERLLQMAELGYRNGVKTKLKVDDAELNLLTAGTNLARARRDYLVARARLLRIMGTDLETALQDGGTCVIGPDPPPAKTNAVDLRWLGGLWGRLSSLPIRGRQAGKPAPHTLKSTALPAKTKDKS